MPECSRIKEVYAREILSMRGHPSIEATVITENGSTGVAEATAGLSIGEYEVQFAYDGGERYRGLGVLSAVKNVTDIIAPALIGVDASQQWKVDEIMLELDGTPNKANLGGNTTASVSAAALKAGAASLSIPLYHHIGGINACILPVPGVGIMNSLERYGGAPVHGDKPSYAFMAYGFDTFTEACYACWDIQSTYLKLIEERFNMKVHGNSRVIIPEGVVKHEKEIWNVMTEAIEKSGYADKMGMQVDVAAGTYYNKEKDVYEYLFSKEDKTRDDMFQLYKDMVKNYPFINIEDPLDEDDFEGHAILTKELGIQIVGDDLFTTNLERLNRGMAVGACNSVLLKVNQVGSISEAFEMVEMAYQKGYGIMPCPSRGEGADIADYSVGINATTIRESASGPTANRLQQIEKELGSHAKFLGKEAFKFGPPLA